MNQLELNLEPNTPSTPRFRYSKDDRCCDPCNQKVVAERLQDHAEEKIRKLYEGAEDFLDEMGADHDSL